MLVHDAVIRDVLDADVPAILALNDEFVEYLAPMEEGDCAGYRKNATYFRVIDIAGEVAGFLIAYRPGLPYGSTNYRWFCETYDDFVYVDRIVISAGQQGKQLGRLFYDDIQAFTRKEGLKRVTCEYNCMPMNVGSQKFHNAYGFTEVGTQWLNDGKKQVSMQSFEVT